MKLFGRLSPGNLDFFFQKQPALGVKHLFDYRYDYRVAFVTDRRHLEDLTTDGNCFNFCVLAKGLSSTKASRVLVCLLMRKRPVSTASTESFSASRVNLWSSIESFGSCSESAASKTIHFPSLV